MTPTAQRIKDLFPLVPDRGRPREWHSPEYVLYGRRQYRGKMQYVAGYSHSRYGSHFMTGRVYDRILGWGNTQDRAIAMMRQKLQKGE